jgi:tetratricopeptide (TPR) repeat protein
MMEGMRINRPGRMESFVLLVLLATGLHADMLVLKSGQTISGKSFVRTGDALVLAAGPNGEPVSAGTGTPLAEIVRVECEPPAVLKNAPAMLAAGKAADVLAALKVALPAAEMYGELPGSCWPDLYSLQAYVLLAMGRDAEAVELATAMKKSKNPGLAADSLALRALIAARKGEHSTAASLAEPVLKEAARPGAVAAASVALGLGHLEKKKFLEALKAFLELPVFLPDETALSGIARLGSAQAYYGMEDYDRAIATLEELVKTQPGIPEISIAQSLLPEWTRRRRAVQEAKEP